MDRTQPYGASPIFDEVSLPGALRKEHRTKKGIWGIVRVIEGSLQLHFADGTPTQLVAPNKPATLLPDQPHWVVPGDRMKMQLDFYDRAPFAKSDESPAS